jgi:hypothetical protein
MEEEDIWRVKVSSHLVQVYDTSTSSRLSTTSIWVETQGGGGRGACDSPLPCGIQKGRTGS